jgi:hypothetical protein
MFKPVLLIPALAFHDDACAARKGATAAGRSLAGEYKIFVGGSSDNTPLTASVRC